MAYWRKQTNTVNDKPKDKGWHKLIHERLESMPKKFKPKVNNVGQFESEVNNVNQVAGEEIWLDIDKI